MNTAPSNQMTFRSFQQSYLDRFNEEIDDLKEIIEWDHTKNLSRSRNPAGAAASLVQHVILLLAVDPGSVLGEKYLSLASDVVSSHQMVRQCYTDWGASDLPMNLALVYRVRAACEFLNGNVLNAGLWRRHSLLAGEWLHRIRSEEEVSFDLLEHSQALAILRTSSIAMDWAELSSFLRSDFALTEQSTVKVFEGILDWISSEDRSESASLLKLVATEFDHSRSPEGQENPDGGSTEYPFLDCLEWSLLNELCSNRWRTDLLDRKSILAAISR